MSTPLVVARGVEKRFGRAAALRGVDLTAAPGETLGLLGPNGAGKSTFLRLVAGLARPSAGEVTVAGEPAGRPAARRHIGLVSHATFLYPDLTARENLVFTARCHGVSNPGDRADTLLADARLDSVADRQAGGFSRGMAQRLAIARGLVSDPQVLLLDEPFTGLDGPSARRLSAHLQEVSGGERAVLLVTHDTTRASELCSAAVVLAAGQIATRLSGAELSATALDEATAAAAESQP